MNLIALMMRVLPDGLLESVNEFSLEELERRKLIHFTSHEWEIYYQTGNDILGEMINSQKCKFILGTSTFEVQNQLFSNLNGQIRSIIHNTQDLNISKLSETFIFQPHKLQGEDFQSAISPLFSIYELFQERMMLNEEMRQQQEFIWLYLQNWDLTFTELRSSVYREEWKHIVSMIRRIIVTGASCNVGLIFDGSGISPEMLGLSGRGFEVRNCLDMYIQDFGSLFIDYFLKIFARYEQERINKIYLHLREAILFGGVNSPIIISFAGNTKIGLVPPSPQRIYAVNNY